MDHFHIVFSGMCFKAFCVFLCCLSFYLSFSVSGHLLSVSVCLVGPKPAVPHQSYSVNTELAGGD